MPSAAANAQGPYPVQTGEKIPFLFDFTPVCKDPTTGITVDPIASVAVARSSAITGTPTMVGSLTQTTVTYLIDFTSIAAGSYFVSVTATLTSGGQRILTEQFDVTARTPTP